MTPTADESGSPPPADLVAGLRREGLLDRPAADAPSDDPTPPDGTGRVLLRFAPAGREHRVPPGVSVFDAASWNGIAIDSTCGGHGTCRKCKVRVSRGDTPITSHDRRTFSEGELAAGWRLACLVSARSDLDVEVPPLVTRPKAATVGVGRQVILRPAVQKRYLELDEPSLAEDSFRRALQLSPGDGDARHNYGWFLCSRQRFADAVSQFGAALALPQYRSHSKTWFAQGVCQARSGDWVAAEKSLLRSYELDAGNPATAVNLAEVLMRRGEYERARFYVGRVNAEPQYANAETLWLAVRIEHRRGNEDGVQQWGEQLQKRFPGSPQAQAYERRKFDE